LALVDAVYDTWTAELHHLCTGILGTYDPAAIQFAAQDHSITHHLDSCSPADAVRIFKRAHRPAAKATPIVARTADIQEEAHAFFSTLYSNPQDPGPHIPLASVTPTLNAALLVASPELVKRAVTSYPADKSGGPDHLHTLILQALLPATSFTTCLSLLFCTFHRLGVTPSAWNHSTIHLLPKSPGAHVDETRPVSLTQVHRRIFERLLLHHLSSTLPAWTHLHHSQGGFRTGYTTITHALTVDHKARTGRFPVKVCLDLSKAFDKVPFSRLFAILSERGCPPPMLSLLHSLMTSSTTSTVHVNKSATAPIARTCGLFQGSCLSPLLFNIFIDPLACQVNGPFARGTNDDPELLLFCDDIIVMADSSERAQHLLDQCSAWAASNNMAFGMSKCQAIVCPTALPPPPPLLLSGSVLATTTTYKYLGFPLTASGIAWIRHGTASIAKAHGFLRGLALSSLHWPEWAKLLIYKTFIRSLATYGLHLSYHYALQVHPERASHRALLTAITKLHKSALRWIFGRQLSQAAMESISALGTPFRHLDELLGSLTLRLAAMPDRNPIVVLLDRLGRAPVWPATYLLPRLLNTPLARRYRALPHPRPTWAVWKKADRIAALRQVPGILHLYISNACRHPTSKIDTCLLIRDPLRRAKCISWRLNRAFHGRLCQVCLEPWNRAHILSCELLHHHPYSVRESAACHLAEVVLGVRGLNFTLLDHSLNTRSYSVFVSLLRHLDQQLVRRAPV
jgi:hypothetical protein